MRVTQEYDQRSDQHRVTAHIPALDCIIRSPEALQWSVAEGVVAALVKDLLSKIDIKIILKEEDEPEAAAG